MTSKQAALILYKKKGETPLECLKRFKKENPEYAKEKMTYAGRLDPLAEGLLIVLIGEECKNKEKYLGFDKEYEVDILFGFSTDTYDVLGKVTGVSDTEKLSIEKVTDVIQSSVGKFTQKYPAFSSKTIKGKSIFSLKF
jgi:tRNA pseudouridine55 synthase